MILLLAFAFLAGAATAITPCVLPVLPALLSASGTGGRRRPIGIVDRPDAHPHDHDRRRGLGRRRRRRRRRRAAHGRDRRPRAVRAHAARPARGGVVAAAAGVPARLAPRGDADGFWSGLPVGGALGFVYAPCAGPILAAVISVSASSGTTGRIVAVGIAYGLGSALVLLGLALGGRELIDRVRRGGRGATLQRSFGAVMVLTAVLMFTSVDLRFQEALASHFPSFLTNPTGGLEKSRRRRGRAGRAARRGRSSVTSPSASPSLSRRPAATPRCPASRRPSSGAGHRARVRRTPSAGSTRRR